MTSGLDILLNRFRDHLHVASRWPLLGAPITNDTHLLRSYLQAYDSGAAPHLATITVICQVTRIKAPATIVVPESDVLGLFPILPIGLQQDDFDTSTGRVYVTGCERLQAGHDDSQYQQSRRT